MAAKLIRRKSPSNDRDVEKTMTTKLFSSESYRSFIGTHVKNQYRETQQQQQHKSALRYLNGPCDDEKKKKRFIVGSRLLLDTDYRDVERTTRKLFSSESYRSFIHTYVKNQYRKTQQQQQQQQHKSALRIRNLNGPRDDEKKKRRFSVSSPLVLDTDMALNGSSPQCFCGICFDFKKHTDMFRGSKCNHDPFCSECISKYVAVQMQQNNVVKVNCPNPDCGLELKPEHLNCILPKDVVDRWESARCESLIAARSKTYCPFKNCSALLVNDGGEGEVVTSTKCPSFHRLFCAQCMVPWHAGMNCKEFYKSMSKEEKDSDRKFLDLAERKMWQRCPKCSFYVERSSGCIYMTCRCRCNFCYNCGKDWNYGHICQMSHDYFCVLICGVLLVCIIWGVFLGCLIFRVL